MVEIVWRDEVGGDPFSAEMMDAIASRQWTPEGTEAELDAKAEVFLGHWTRPKTLEFWFLTRLAAMGKAAALKRLIEWHGYYYDPEGSREIVAAGMALHFGLTPDGIAAFAKLFPINAEYRGGLDALLSAHTPELVEVFFKLSQLKTLRTRVPDIDAWLTGEGANAVEGLVQMCARRGKRRDFAFEKLAAYVESGHVAMIEESLARVPDKIAALVRAEVVSPPEPEEVAPQTALPPSDYPEWLSGVATLPDELVLGWLRGEFPLECRIQGKEGAIPRALACRIVTATYLDQGSRVRYAINTYSNAKDSSARELSVEDVTRAVEGIEAMPRPWEEGGIEGLWMQLVEALRAGFIDRSYETVSILTMTLATLGTPSDFVWLGDRLRKGLAIGDDSTIKRGYVEAAALYRANDPRAWAELVNATVTAKRLRESLELDCHPHIEGMGVTWEQAYDRFVPTFGFDEAGAQRFDYGARVFALTFDETFALAFREESTGKVYKTLPPARKGEDKARVAEHKAAYKRTKLGLTRTVEWAKARFEDALVTMRSWSLDELRTYLLPHPLMRHVVRGLVWGVHDEDLTLTTSFVFEQDGALTSSTFDEVELPGDSRVRLVHPIELTEAQRRAWSVALADSEISQPVLQLERSFMAAEGIADEIDFFTRVNGKWGWVKALDDKDPNWVRGATYKGSKRVWYIKRDLPELGIEARLLVKRNDWILPRGGDEPRAGLHLFEAGAVSAPENSLPLERAPARVLVEILREVREA